MLRARWPGPGEQGPRDRIVAAPRVVLDTNVLLSALLFSSGRLSVLREAWQSERMIPLVSSVTAAELLRVLSYPKFTLSNADQQELIADVLPYCTVVRMPKAPPRTPACRDPHDEAFLELAAIGKAKFLVTGDRDLLSIRERLSYQIVNPQAFLEELT